MIESWEGARDILQDKLAALNELIGAYPGPITGCDAQFNHMLEERSGLNAELARLDQAAKAHSDKRDLDQFLQSCLYLADKQGTPDK